MCPLVGKYKIHKNLWEIQLVIVGEMVYNGKKEK